MEAAADVVILTALGLELRAIREHLTGLQEVVHPRKTIYEVGTFDANRQLTVAIAEIGTGNSLAALGVERAVSFFDPSMVIFVGVAGGLKDVSIGDVAVADCVYGYEPAKESAAFAARVKTHHSTHELVQLSRNIASHDDWRRRITEPPDSSPHAFVGPLAAGEKVLASQSSTTLRRLRQHCGDALGVEMEGWGFLEAAYANDHVPAIVIRGISDLVSDKRPAEDLVRQPAAAKHAAAFAFELVARSAFPFKATRTKPSETRSFNEETTNNVYVNSSMEHSYADAIRTIRSALSVPQMNNTLSLVSMHGPDRNRIGEGRGQGETILQEFDQALAGNHSPG